MRLRLDSQNPETYYNDGFIVCWLLHGPTDIRRLFSAHGAAALSPMIPIAPPSIFGKLWKMNSTERFPTWCLRSQIGRRKGNFLGLSVRFSPQLKSEQLYPIEDSDRIIFVTSFIYVSSRVPDPSLDTVLYEPLDPEARLRGLEGKEYAHEDMRDHRLVGRVVFRANRMFSFLRTGSSLHGVGQVSDLAAPRHLISLRLKHADQS